MSGSYAPQHEQQHLTPVPTNRLVEGLQVQGSALPQATSSHRAALPACSRLSKCQHRSLPQFLHLQCGKHHTDTHSACARGELVWCCSWNSCSRYSATDHAATTPLQSTPKHLGYVVGTTAQRPTIDLTKSLSAQTKPSTPPSPAPGFKLTSSAPGVNFLSQMPNGFYRNHSNRWWCQRSFLTVLNVGLVPMAGHHSPQTEPPLSGTGQETATAEAS